MAAGRPVLRSSPPASGGAVPSTDFKNIANRIDPQRPRGRKFTAIKSKKLKLRVPKSNGINDGCNLFRR